VSKQTIQPARAISGALQVPGDKSISHRYAILASLAQGHGEIENYSSAADCGSTLECLKRLGTNVERSSKGGEEKIVVAGGGLDGWRKPRRSLDCGNSGTSMRLMAGLLAGQPFDSKMTGDDSLRRRPMRRVIEPLALMGANISARDGNFAPLEIRGTKLRPIQYTLPVASAQVKSAVLLAGLLAEGETSVEESVRTRDHTELALTEFGADVCRTGQSVRVVGRPRLQARRLSVPGDLSSAAFFLAAALILPGSRLLLHRVGLNPTRAALLDVLAEWGAEIKINSLRSEHGELVGDISVEHAPVSGGVLSGAQIAQLIDELPMLAALGPYTEQGVEIRDASELRVKESDRIAVMAKNLRLMGAKVDERPDGLYVEGRSAGALRGAEVDSHGDHRMAMALAVAGLGAREATRIHGAECAAVSYPDFFSVLEKLLTR
jgi:3-phosphoshikimate 1-carboxyvinyltransferase